MNKLIPIIAIIALAVGVGSFYSGMKYGQGQSPAVDFQANLGSFRNMSNEDRQQRMAEMGTGAGAGFTAQRTGFINGEIISKDDESITIKLADSSSRIVFYSPETKISKIADGLTDDLVVGETVMVTGETDQNGIVSAQSIQLAPLMRLNIPEN